MKDRAPEIKIASKVAVRLSGTGGQGLLLAGRILAEASAIFDGMNVVQSNSYGPEARGGASRSEVVISKGEVDDLRRKTFDVLVALSQKACDSYYGDLNENGVLIVDSTNVSVLPTSRAVEIPMTKMAVEECGDRMVTNMISLGALCGCTNIVTIEALKSALKTTLRADLLKKNLKALEMGYEAAKGVVQTPAVRKRTHVTDYSYVREDTPLRRRARKNGHGKTSPAGAYS